MDNSKKAFPHYFPETDTALGTVGPQWDKGMTLREYYAGLAMQGITVDEYTRFGMDACINLAVLKADTLIAKLEETK